MKQTKPIKQPVKCIVSICKNYYCEETKGDLDFFNVPSRGHAVYKKWCRLLQLSGNRTEKICSVHFRRKDFFENHRLKMKENAVPSVGLVTPVKDKKLKFGAICCIEGCFTKTRNILMRFPGKKKLLNSWKRALQMSDADSTKNLMICHRHFKDRDFRKVLSLYLRPCAVPSRRMQIPKSQLPPERPKGPTYSQKMRSDARSNRLCSVPGCLSRSIKGIVLHNFPAQTDPYFAQWVENMKFKQMPAKRSFVCSLHFEKSSYIIGSGKRLKKYAVPTILQPDLSSVEELLDVAAAGEEALDAEQLATMNIVKVETEDGDPLADNGGDEDVSTYLELYHFEPVSDEES